MEGRLGSLRPGDLPPVPAGDSDEMDEMPALTAGGSRGRLRSRSGADRGKGTGEAAQRSEEAERIRSRERFRTPASWQATGGSGMRTSVGRDLRGGEGPGIGWRQPLLFIN